MPPLTSSPSPTPSLPRRKALPHTQKQQTKAFAHPPVWGTGCPETPPQLTPAEGQGSEGQKNKTLRVQKYCKGARFQGSNIHTVLATRGMQHMCQSAISHQHPANNSTPWDVKPTTSHHESLQPCKHAPPRNAEPHAPPPPPNSTKASTFNTQYPHPHHRTPHPPSCPPPRPPPPPPALRPSPARPWRPPAHRGGWRQLGWTPGGGWVVRGWGWG